MSRTFKTVDYAQALDLTVRLGDCLLPDHLARFVVDSVAHLSLLSGSPQSLHLFTDGEGSWTTESGEAFPLLTGCLDVDISATPFTNTLPIRRLTLRPDSAATLSMVYIAVPQMHVEVTEQRYTCLEVTSSGGRYCYESLVNGVSQFTVELPVDRDGLVLDYPGLFRREGTW